MSVYQQHTQYSGWFNSKDKAFVAHSHSISNMPRPPPKTCPQEAHVVVSPYSRTHASSFHAKQLQALRIAEPCPSYASSSMLSEVVGIEAGVTMALTVVLAALCAKLDNQRNVKNRTDLRNRITDDLTTF